MRRARTTAVLFALALVWAALPGHAHTIHFPKRAVVDVHPGHVRIGITQIYDGDGAGREIKERFDRDGSGAIEESEFGALQGFLVGRARRTLSVSIDGVSVPLEIREQVVSGHERDARGDGLHLWLVVEGRWSRELSGVQLTIADSIPDGRREVALEIVGHGVDIADPSSGRVEPVERDEQGAVAVRGVAVGPGQPWSATVRIR